jgi:hypothetical protein
MRKKVLLAGQPKLVNDLLDGRVANPIATGAEMEIDENARLRRTQEAEHLPHDDWNGDKSLIACFEDQGVRTGEKFVPVSQITW